MQAGEFVFQLREIEQPGANLAPVSTGALALHAPEQRERGEDRNVGAVAVGTERPARAHAAAARVEAFGLYRHAAAFVAEGGEGVEDVVEEARERF